MPSPSFLGLRTVIYPVTDLERAKAWYRSVLGIDPYFDQPFYVGFNVGGFELGLDPDGDVSAGKAGAVAYWGVERMNQTWPRLLQLGAKAVRDPMDVGEGIQVATVQDPFGNLFGVIENPHFPNKA